MSLTPVQIRHLRELSALREGAWYPRGAERRTAYALASRGLVRQVFGIGVTAFELTDGGRIAAETGHVPILDLASEQPASREET